MISPLKAQQSARSHSKAHKTLAKYILNLAFSLILMLTYPAAIHADMEKYNVVTDEFYGLNAERILLVSTPDEADRTVLMTGKCKSRAATEIYLEDDPINAREKWYVLTDQESLEPDMQICLTGNLPAWFEKVSLTN